MQRIMIIGCGGSGKSTIAKQLQHLLKLELIHLDAHFFTGNWVEIDRDEWQTLNQTLVKKQAWIMDGNYGSTMHMRIDRADTIIFMDFPTTVRLWRVFWRTFRNHGTARPDMPPECRERFSWQFFHYILMYNPTRRKGILKKLDAVRPEKRIEILRNNRQVKAFLHAVAVKRVQNPPEL